MSYRVPSDCRRGRLSPEEEDRIAAMADRGLNSGQVARKLNRHPSTINFAFVRLGLRRRAMKVRPDYERNGRRVIAFRPDEDELITNLRLAGAPCAKIADAVFKHFGHQRTPATIGIRLKMLAAQDDDR